MNAFIRKYRGRIEQIDRRIVRLVGARIKASRLIGTSKGEDVNAELYDRERERSLYDLWSATTDELFKAAEYITTEGNQRVILCERGIRTFEPSTRSTLDLSAITVLREKTHLPIIVDPSHAAGRRELVIPLALATAAAGADGLLVEVHPRPEEALCDGDQALTIDDFRDLIARLRPIIEAQGRSM